MRRILIALGCLVVLVGAGYYGATVWAQHRAEREVEAVFANARAKGNNATHGPVRFDLIRRTLTIADVVSGAPDDPGSQLRIGRVLIGGMSQPDQAHLAARRIEISDVTVIGKLPLLPDLRATFRAPHLEIVDYSGPAALPEQADSGSPVGVIHAVLVAFAATSMASLTAPELSLSIAGTTTTAQPALRSAEYHYTGVALQGIRDGKVGTLHLDRIALSGDTGAPQVGNFASEGANFTLSDLDSGPILAAFDPAGNAPDGYRSVYRHVSAGPYTISFGPTRLQIEAITADDVALNPAKFTLATLIPKLQALPQAGGAASPQQLAQVQDLFNSIAALYEGVRVNKAEGRGITVNGPGKETIAIAAVRLTGFENGRIAEMAVEGVDGMSSQEQPVKIGRFALEGIGIADFVRTAARLSLLKRKPEGADFVALLRLLDGAELKGLTAPYQSTGKVVDVDTAKISWGKFVGPLPSRARATLRITGPVGMAGAPLFKPLADAGFSTATLAFDVGAEWNEGNRDFVLAPGTIQLTNIGSLDAKATLANVPPSAFSTDPTALILAGIMVEVGEVEITLHDLGGLDLAVAQTAKARNMSPDAARQLLVETVTQPIASLAGSNGDFAALAEAAAKFIESPGGTLTVKVTPKGHVMLMQLVAALQAGPAAAFANFHLEASVSK